MLEPVHFLQFIVPRLDAAVRRLGARIWTRSDTPLAVSASRPSDRIVDVRSAKGLAYQPVTKLPHVWGRMFDQRWWRVKLPKPADDGVQRYLVWDDQAEATAYVDGEPVFGFDPGHKYFAHPDGVRSLMIESTCCRTGVWVPENLAPMSEHGSVFNGAYLAVRDDDAWHAWIDLMVLVETLALVHLPDYPTSDRPDKPFGFRPPIHQAPPIYRRVVRQLNDAIGVYEKSGPGALRRALGKVYRSLAIDRRSCSATMIGHAHLDLVWLWPKQTARFKAVHSMANALSVMQRYPKVHFTYSQPASYSDVQTISPGLMQRVRDKVRTGRWEATGTMWVESDTQLPCGEALVRSFALGREGFIQINGKRRGSGDVVWLPDTFGYSGCIPQVMAGFGVPYFFTTKIHWGNTTRFPYTSFRWRGHDGSEVLANIIQNDYNLRAEPKQIKTVTDRHQQSDVHPEVLVPTGYGDGGGGPSDEMAERVERISKLGLLGEAAGLPDVKWGRIDAFFDRLNAERGKLPVWSGEMYLQYHRGVQTTHGNIKGAYRAAERALQVLEAAHCATGRGPIDRALWRTLVFNQFHDCLPGSSIWEVCVQAIEELNALRDTAMGLVKEVLNRKRGRPCVFNPLAMEQYVVEDRRALRVPALSGVLRDELAEAPTRVPEVSRGSLGNDRIAAAFDQYGRIKSLVIDGQPIALSRPGAQLWVLPDHPNAYDAWDIDRHTLSQGEQVLGPAEVRCESRGALHAGVCFTRKVGKQSEVTMRYRLDPVRPVLLIDVEVDWHEPQTLLKLAFPTAYRGPQARYGAPFGSTLRAQLPGPLEADAMFEAPGSRWAAVADDGESDGLAIVSEAKYGFGCMDGLLHVSLLRSALVTRPIQGPPRRAVKGGDVPTYSDLGRHTIRLAVGRFSRQAPSEEQPPAWAETLFNPPLEYVGRPVSAGLGSLSFDAGVVPAWAKPIDKGRWVLRLHETLGRAGVCRLDPADAALTRLDLNDQALGHIKRGRVDVKPYELVSVGVGG